MSGRFFLDTNIFVYAFDDTAQAKKRIASNLIREAIATRQGIVSYQVVQEFMNVAMRRFSHPMSHAEAEQYLANVLRPLLSIHSSSNLYLEALRISGRHKFAWYDSLIVAGALQGECASLLSEDMQTGRVVEGLKIENPF
jgi:predicted nucleic acid-binding protein